MSDHQKENIELGKGGHNYGVADAKFVLDNPTFRLTDPTDKREVRWGNVGGDVVKVVASATVSAGTFIWRIVSAHRHPGPKKS